MKPTTVVREAVPLSSVLRPAAGSVASPHQKTFAGPSFPPPETGLGILQASLRLKMTIKDFVQNGPILQ